jgi:hypothetical protein
MPLLDPLPNPQTPPVTLELDITKQYTVTIGIVNTVVQITISPVPPPTKSSASTT